MTSASRSMTVPRSWNAVTPGWVSAVLRRHCDGALVSDVDLGEIDIGTTSRAFARLTYSAGHGPERVFIKAQGSIGHRLLLASTGVLFGEARILAHRDLLPLETPIVYGSVVERRTLRTITVMEDVSARGAFLNNPAEPMSPTDVASALGCLAQLHSAYWDRPLPPQLSWVKPWRMGPGYLLFGAVAPRKALTKLRKTGHLGVLPRPPWSVGDGLAMLRCSCRLARCGPQTLLHGDAHIGNTYLLPDRRVGFYDWQFIRSGSWAHDVGYLLGSSLSVQDRRAHEQDLLRGYLDSLTSNGAGPTVPTFDQAWRRYRQTPAYGLHIWLGIHASDDLHSADNSLATIERFARAFDDLETAAAV